MLRSFTIALLAVGALSCSNSNIISKSEPVNNQKYDKLDNHIIPQGFTGLTYYVNPNGSDNNTGTSVSEPLKTIQAAADKTQPGDTVLVMNGTYHNKTDEMLVNIKNSGTETNWIKYANFPGHQPHLKASSSGGFFIQGASYLLIEGFKIEGPQDDVTLDYAKAEQENKYNKVTSNTGIALKPYKTADGSFRYGHHLVIQNNEVFKFNCNGIGFTRGDYLLVQNNKVHHNAFYSPWACSGISTWSNWNFDHKKDRYRVIFRNNETYNNYNHIKFWMQGKITDGNGIIIDALKLDQGVIKDGFAEEYSGFVLVENNVSHHNGGRGINIYHSDNIDIINNTTYHNGQHPTMSSELGIGRSDNIRLFNNIFVAAPDREMFLYYGSENIQTDHNLFYGYTKMSMPIDEKALVIHQAPQFKDAEALNFKLQANSPAIDKASTTNSAQFDFTGKPRLGAADLGAFEF